MIWELAGALGLHPGPYTLAQLLTMARGRAKAMWSHTSHVLCLLANINRDTKRRPQPFAAWEFDPYGEYQPRGMRFTKETSRLLAAAMTGKRPVPDKPTRWQMLNETLNDTQQAK